MHQIRTAIQNDIPDLLKLLYQVGMVHYRIRPDLFRANATKYSAEQLHAMIGLPEAPIFVCTDGENNVLGYAFCVIQHIDNDGVRTAVKTLYIDDLCVDERFRGQHVGQSLFEYVKAYAKSIGCHNLTLNVWEGNASAFAFYRAMGLRCQKYGMECLL